MSLRLVSVRTFLAALVFCAIVCSPVNLIAQDASASSLRDMTATQAVGQNDGSYSTPDYVTANGTFSYSYPIRIPDGTAGMQPSISLDYNSGAPNGQVGLGFSLSGFPAITRDTSYPVDFTSLDHYMYQGEKLVYSEPTATPTPGDGRYHRKRENYERIELFSSPTSTTLQKNANYTTSYWKITQKDGTRLYFGYTDDSRIDAIGHNGLPRLWALSRVEDTKGNYYEITYFHSATTGDYLPLRIVYTKNDAYSPAKYHAIDFTYDYRTSDRFVVYSPTRVDMGRRLKWITVRSGVNVNGVGGYLVRKYSLSYIYSNQTKFSQLDSVLEWGSDGDMPPFGLPTQEVLDAYAPQGSTLPPTNFTWLSELSAAYDGSSDIQTPSGTTYQTDLKADDGVNIITGDFNGDGRTDFIRQEKGGWASDNSGTFKVYLATSSGTTYTIKSSAGTDYDDVLKGEKSIIYVGDFNGDGKDDFIRQPATYVSSSDRRFAVYTSVGDGTFTENEPTGNVYTSDLICANGPSNRGVNLILGDFNGDGRSDFIRQEKYNYSGNPMQVFLSNGSGGFNLVNPTSSEDPQDLRYNDGCTIIPGDYNGDGLTDFIRQERGAFAGDDVSSFQVYFSKGDGHFTFVTPSGSVYQHNLKSEVADGARIIPGDYNGDGKTDFIRQEYGDWAADDVITFQVYISAGDGTFEILTPAGINNQVDLKSLDDYGAHIIPGDFNGDGRTDFIREEYGTWANDDATSFQIYISQGDSFLLYTPAGNDYQHFIKESSGGGVNIIPGDFNGDGVTDFIRQQFGGWSTDTTRTFQVYLSTGQHDLLRRVANLSSTINQVSVSYTPATLMAGAIPTAGSYPATVPNTSPRSLVSSIRYSDGLGGSTEYTYAYTDGRRYGGSPKNREDFGFATVSKTNGTTGVKTTTTYSQDKPWQGLPTMRVVYEANSTDKASVTHWFYDKVAIAPMTDVLFVYPIYTFNKVYDDNSTPLVTLHRNTSYDAYGNLIQEVDYGYVDGDDPADWTDLDPNDDVLTNYSYAQNVSSTAYIFAPAGTKVRSYNSANALSVVSYTKRYYDGLAYTSIDAGLLTKVTLMINEAADTWVSTSTGYDDWGNPIWTRDANSTAVAGPYTTQTTYDADYHSHPASSANAVGQTVTMAYDDLVRPISVTDPNGQVTQTVYDVFSRVTATVAPGDTLSLPTTKVEYDLSAIPNVVHTMQKEDATGNYLESYRYTDGLGRQVQSKQEGPSTNWITVNRFYNGAGPVIAISKPHQTSASGYSTPDTNIKTDQFEYDALDRVIKVTKPDGSYSRTVYNQKTAYAVDDNSHVVATTTPTDNRITEVRRYTGIYPTQTFYSLTTTKTYQDKQTVTDNAGNVIIKVSDGLGRLVSYSDTDMGTWTYQYDANGNLTHRTDAKGTTIDYSYDGLNRLTLVHDPLGTNVSYSYDQTGHGFGIGHLTTITYARGNDSFTYDAQGQVSAVTRTLDGISKTLSSTYDPMGRLATQTYPDGEVVTNVYEQAGRLVSVTGTDQYASGMTYLSDGRLTGMTYGNGLVNAYTYYSGSTNIDPVTGVAFNGRLSDIKVGTTANPTSVLSLRFGYDRVGNVKQRIDNNTAAYSETYTYDTLDRLTQAVSTQSGTLNYTYNTIDNVLTKEGKTYTYATGTGAKPHAVTGNGTSTYTYNANGSTATRVTGGVTRTITYDGLNRVASVSDGGSYVYDGGYQRMIKTEGTAVSYYFFPQYEEEYSTATGTPVLSQSIKYYSANGQKIAQRSSTTGLLYIHSDHLGSSTRMTDATGTVVRSQGYKPYGADAYSSGSGATKYQYTGQEKESTGLYYYNARYYDPDLGRFVSADPAIFDITLGVGLSLRERLNPYMYVLGNPVRYTDPSGLVFGLAIRIGLAVIRGENAFQALQNSKNFGEAVGAIIFGIDPADTRARIKALQDKQNSSNETAGGHEEENSQTRPKADVQKSSSTPPANGGQGPQHGNDEHNDAIDNKAKELIDKEYIDVRKNQQQVDANGDVVGTNRPDLQGTNPQTGAREYYEWDHSTDRSADHGLTILKNDPAGEVTLSTF